MADTKISALTALAGADVDVAADVLPIVDTGATTTKKILVEELAKAVAATQAQVNAMTSTSTLLTPNINKIVLGTEAASTSGTTVDYTSIPAGVRRITIMFNGVSTNGTSQIIVQLGDSGGFEPTGYQSAAYSQGGGSGTTSTAGIAVATPTAAAGTFYGSVILSLENSSNYTWVSQSNVYDSNSGNVYIGAGAKATSAQTDRLRITTAGGSDTFDSGAINISFER